MKKPCLKCAQPLWKQNSTGYCAKCVVTAKTCKECGVFIAAFNKSGLCPACSKPKKT